MKNLKLRSNSFGGERIIKAFKLAFENETNLNIQLKDRYISYVGGILTKVEFGNQSIAVGGRWISV